MDLDQLQRSRITLNLRELNKNIPGYLKRTKSPQVKAKYRLHIYEEEITNLTKATKKKPAITTSQYKRANSSTKGYKNLEWLDKMYERKLKEDGLGRRYFKVIIPEHLPKGYKLYDKKGEYYGTVIAEDEVFYYIVSGKREVADPFLKDFIERMFLQGQCGGKYGFSVPLEFIEGYERSD